MSCYGFIKKAARPVYGFLFRCHPVNIPEKLPDGPLVLCSNHISLCDAVILAMYLDRKVTFMAKNQLFRIPVIRLILKKCGVIPVSRNGSDMSAVRSAVGVLKNSGFISIFPQGTRCNLPVEKTSFKAGAGFLISATGANVICAAIYSKNYKVRPFKRTEIVFGTPHSVSIPDGISGKEKNEFVTEAIFNEVVSISKEAESIS